MINGPTVLWFGGNESLSTELSAYLVFEGEPPDYISFGQAREVDGPPYEMEGITRVIILITTLIDNIV